MSLQSLSIHPLIKLEDTKCTNEEMNLGIREHCIGAFTETKSMAEAGKDPIVQYGATWFLSIICLDESDSSQSHGQALLW